MPNSAANILDQCAHNTHIQAVRSTALHDPPPSKCGQRRIRIVQGLSRSESIVVQQISISVAAQEGMTKGREYRCTTEIVQRLDHSASNVEHIHTPLLEVVLHRTLLLILLRRLCVLPFRFLVPHRFVYDACYQVCVPYRVLRWRGRNSVLERCYYGPASQC